MHFAPLKHFKRYLRWTFFSLLSGLLSGVAVTIFLFSLNWVTNYREQHSALIWALPFAGLLSGWIYFKYAGDVGKGHNLILEEIHDPKQIIPTRMTPLIFFSTLLTHLFGGSAGREGTAVQMSASLSDQLSRFFKIETHERKILLMAGTGAGFGAALGAPWAGAIFGMEVIQIGRLHSFAWVECLIASFTAYGVTLFLHAPHSHFEILHLQVFDWKTFFYVALAGILFGLAARFFILLVHFIETMQAKFIKYPPLRPFVGGILLVLFFQLEGSFQYAGLGIPVIQSALTEVSHWVQPVLKMFFSGLTVGSGFKGGEFIPLVFIGTTLGSALSQILPVAFQLLAALGFAAVFAGAANTPIACSLMAIEIFGPDISLYAIIACVGSYLVSGQRGIYKSQKPTPRKKKYLFY